MNSRRDRLDTVRVARITGRWTGRVWAGPRVAVGSSVIQVEGNNCLDQGPLVPSPRASSENGRVRVVGVESEPLTDEQMTAAIRALSGLIVAYWETSDAPETFAG